MATEANQRANADEIDFTAIFAILWRQRKLIIFGTLAATLFAAVFSFFIPKTYRSEGFYQIGTSEKRIEEKNIFNGVPIPLYKKSASQFFNPNRVFSFASQEKTFSEKDLDRIKMDFQTETDIIAWITPVFAYSKGGMREVSQSDSVLGLNLSYEADSPQKAYKYVRFFGQFVRDCLLYVSLYEYIKDEYSRVISELSGNENQIIDLQFSLLQNTKKMLDIKSILTRYPEAAKMETRQIVSVQEGGFRFLGPVTQLVGIESVLADQRRALDDLERKKEKLIIRREYFSKCNDALNKIGSRGGMIFSQLKAIKVDVFKNKDFSKGTVKEVFNDLNIALQTFDRAFFTNCRFISGPTYPTRHIKPRKSVIVVIAGLLSFFFFVILALALHWWQANRQTILKSQK